MSGRKRREPVLPPEYSLVALTEPKWAALLAREATRTAGDRRSTTTER